MESMNERYSGLFTLRFSAPLFTFQLISIIVTYITQTQRGLIPLIYTQVHTQPDTILRQFSEYIIMYIIADNDEHMGIALIVTSIISKCRGVQSARFIDPGLCHCGVCFFFFKNEMPMSSPVLGKNSYNTSGTLFMKQFTVRRVGFHALGIGRFIYRFVSLVFFPSNHHYSAQHPGETSNL